jgi:hypothetical protein
VTAASLEPRAASTEAAEDAATAPIATTRVRRPRRPAASQREYVLPVVRELPAAPDFAAGAQDVW